MTLTYSTIIDISRPIHRGMVIYPSNPELEIEQLKSSTSSSVLSKITIGSHTGTHVDAPTHALDNGKGVDEIPLSSVVGPCRVLDMTSVTDGIMRKDLEDRGIQSGERILFKTQNSLRGYDTFYDDFIYVSPEAAIYLAQIDVVCVGIDSLSIKQRGNPDNTPHTALLEKKIAIIEGINLAEVTEDEYFLVAQPLRLQGVDGSPVRALLLA